MRAKKAKNMIYAKKLIFSYSIISLLSVMILGYFTYYSSNEMMKKNIKANIEGTLSQMIDNICYKMEVNERITLQISSDTFLQQLLSKDYSDPEHSYEMKNALTNLFNTYFNLTKDDVLITLYIENPGIQEIYYVPHGKLVQKQFEVYQADRIRGEDWFKNLDAGFDRIKWFQSDEDKKYGLISGIIKLYDFTQKIPVPLGYVVIQSNLEDVFSAVDSGKTGSGSSLSILCGKNDRIFSSDPNEAKGSSELAQLLQIERRIPDSDYQIKASIPLTLFAENSRNIRVLTFFVCLLSFLLSMTISLLFSRKLSQNIIRITRSLKAFRNGDFDVRISCKGRDELVEIAVEFNQMANTIHELNEKDYLANLYRKELELELLQAQINPHFLYNTLSSISKLANLGEIAKLDKTVVSLSKFYRLSLSQGKTIIPIESELEQVRAYIAIQKIKYVDRIHELFEIEPETLKYVTIKFILQPFVENIEKHAWRDYDIHITIRAHVLEGLVCLEVTDDGIGMSPELIDEIFSFGTQDTGYGIRNVDQRIKLQFGEEFGVSIHSRPGMGTTVKILLPAVEESALIRRIQYR